MKKVLAILLSMGFILCTSVSITGQEKPINKSPADTTHIKIKVPQKQFHKQNVRIKKTENQYPTLENPELWKRDRTLLIKEKDSLQKKME
jgi:hypothetical protein